MIALVEMAEHQHLQQQAEQHRGQQRECDGGEEASRQAVEHHCEVGAQHVLHAMGEVDEIHHPEHESEARGHQEQQNAELQPVEQLDYDQRRRHGGLVSRSRSSSPSVARIERTSPTKGH
jgi:hypothetical protein